MFFLSGNGAPDWMVVFILVCIAAMGNGVLDLCA